MGALEIFAYFAGVSLLVGAFALLLKVVRQPTITVYTDAKTPPLPSREERLRDLGFKREGPVWTYKKTTRTYVPRETKPKTGTKGAQPTKSAGRKPLPDDPDLSTKLQ